LKKRTKKLLIILASAVRKSATAKQEFCMGIPASQSMVLTRPSIQIPFRRELLRVLCAFVVQIFAFFLGPWRHGGAAWPLSCFLKKQVLSSSPPTTHMPHHSFTQLHNVSRDDTSGIGPRPPTGALLF
jgi:hypothetical protein